MRSLLLTYWEQFVALDVDDMPLFPAVSWYRSVTAGLVDNIGKVFTSAFTSSGESGQTAALATKNLFQF